MMGLLEAVRLGANQVVLNLVGKSDEAKEFRRIVHSDRLQAALAWLRAQFRSG